MTPLVIIGAGGHGAEIASYANDMGIHLLGAFDDGRHPGPWHVTSVIGGLAGLVEFCEKHPRANYITAFGNNELRRRVTETIAGLNCSVLEPYALLHPLSWKGVLATVGEGTLLAPYSVVATRATIGNHCIINVKASVSHDSKIGDWCNINPGATICGDVEIGEGCYIGAGATVLEKRKIGAWTVIGAGAVVTEDLPSGVTAVGVPARIIRQNATARA